jgi:murein DD-endopeptidase MepM/ murein hydrolase activator NlpD
VLLAAVLIAVPSGRARTAPASAETAPVAYRWPVRGPVIRAFEQPANPYAAGHRGIDIAVPFGTPVGASASGVVAFAGVVAGSRFVSIDHPDGIRTTYSWLSRVDVRAGRTIAAGAVLGATGHGHPEVERRHLHFGARRGSTYVDPLVLLGAAAPGVHLAPFSNGHAASAEPVAVRGREARAGSRYLRPAREVPADWWLWSRTEPKPRVLPGRAWAGGP